jgi:hypothetical protein
MMGLCFETKVGRLKVGKDEGRTMRSAPVGGLIGE